MFEFGKITGTHCPAQLIWVSEDRELWHHMVANVVTVVRHTKERKNVKFESVLDICTVIT